MAKQRKTERRAFDALKDAAKASKIAKKAAKELRGKPARTLRDLALEAAAIADVSKKKVRKHPKRVAKRAAEAATKLAAATEVAFSGAKRKTPPIAPTVSIPTVSIPTASIPPAPAVPAGAPASLEVAAHITAAADAPAVITESSWTVAQLRARARAEGKAGYSRLTKTQLLDLLGLA